MDTDEKNKFSSNINEFDKNFLHKDKNEQAKEDREYMKGHKRVTEDQPELDVRKGPHHDPNNEPLREPDRKNRKLNEPLDMEASNIKSEEEPTNREMHHLYIPEAKVKPHKEKPRKVSHEKFVELPGGQKKEVKREIYDTEIIHNKQTQYPGKTNFAHGSLRKGN